MADTDSTSDRNVEIQNRYKSAREHASKWRTQAKECYEFYSGRHWSEEDIEKLNREGRPPIVFNRAAILIDAVLGYETNNRTETRYIPRTLSDARITEFLTSASDFFRDQCDAEFHESDAFRDSMICGMGWTGDRISDETNPEYDLIRERVDPFEMRWDPSAREPNLADARYLFRTKMFDRQEVRAMFPDWDGEVGSDEWMVDDDFDSDPGSTDPRQSYKTGDVEGSTKRDIPVIEYQWKDQTTVYMVAPPPGPDGTAPEPVELTAKQFKSKKAYLDANDIKYAKKKKTEYRRKFLVGGNEVKEDVICPHGFTYHCVTGKRDRNKGQWIGIMAALLDPQKWSNKWLSQILHVLNTSAKPGYDAEKSAIEDVQKFETNAAKPGAVNIFTDGSLSQGRAQYRNPAPMPSGHEKLLEYANKSFQDVSGINQELLGMADREQAGVLEWQRKQSAVTLLAPLFDSLRRYRKMAGRTWLYLMTKYMSDGRAIRITQDEQEGPANFDPRWKEEDVSRYDVIIDQASTAPNQKEATWAVMQTLLPIIQDMVPPPVMLTLLEYSPMPESLVTKIKKQIAEMPPPQDPEAKKLELEQKKAEMQIQLKREELEMKKQQAQVDAQIDMEKAKQEMQIEAMKAENQLKIEMIKANNQIQLDQYKAAQQAQLAERQSMQQMGMEERRFGFEARQSQQQMALDERMGSQKLAMDKQAGEQKLTQSAAMANQALKAQRAKAKAQPNQRKAP